MVQRFALLIKRIPFTTLIYCHFLLFFKSLIKTPFRKWALLIKIKRELFLTLFIKKGAA